MSIMSIVEQSKIIVHTMVVCITIYLACLHII